MKARQPQPQPKNADQEIIELDDEEEEIDDVEEEDKSKVKIGSCHKLTNRGFQVIVFEGNTTLNGML